jgi:NADH-quinone oxidoreductase subunit I/NAD(P)H-quinone oxidoreductase subunit I
MGALGDYLAAIGRSVLSLGDGLAVTFSYLWRQPVTLQYPDRTAIPVVKLLPPLSRGMLEVDLDLCTGCGACDRACPIHCIRLEVVKAEGGRLIRRFDIDLAKCMYCSLCVEACPTAAIRHSHEFEGGTCDPRNLTLSFVDAPRPPAKPKQDPPPPAKPLGSILRARMPGPWHRPGSDRARPEPTGQGGPHAP